MSAAAANPSSCMCASHSRNARVRVFHRDSKPCVRHHLEIIEAVADGNRLRGINIVLRA